MRLNGVEPLEMQQRFDEAGACGIAIEDREKIRPEGLRNAGIVSHDVGEGLTEQQARNVAMVETRGDPIDHGRFQAVMVQHRCQHQLGENGLPPKNLVRLAPHASEEGIGVRDVDHLGGLTLSHDPISERCGLIGTYRGSATRLHHVAAWRHGPMRRHLITDTAPHRRHKPRLLDPRFVDQRDPTVKADFDIGRGALRPARRERRGRPI